MKSSSTAPTPPPPARTRPTPCTPPTSLSSNVGSASLTRSPSSTIPGRFGTRHIRMKPPTSSPSASALSSVRSTIPAATPAPFLPAASRRPTSSFVPSPTATWPDIATALQGLVSAVTSSRPTSPVFHCPISGTSSPASAASTYRLLANGGLSLYEIARAIHLTGIRRISVTRWINQYAIRPIQ